MTDRREPNQLTLFDEVPGESLQGSSGGSHAPLPDLPPQPWRASVADGWTKDAPPSGRTLEWGAVDLVVRDLQFLKAWERHAEDVETPEFGRFIERHAELVRHLVRWKADRDPAQAEAVQETVNELGRIRREAHPESRRRVMVAERKVQFHEVRAEDHLRMAAFELSEARGELETLVVRDPAGRHGPTEEDGAGSEDDYYEAIVVALDVALDEESLANAMEAAQYEDIHGATRTALAHEDSAELLYERTPEGRELWYGAGGADGSGNGSPAGETKTDACGYGLLFVSPSGSEFRFEFQGEGPGEEGARSQGMSQIGYALALSRIVPVALLRLTSVDLEGDRAVTRPDIHLRHFDEPDGAPRAEGEVLQELLDPEALERLENLRERIVEVLADSDVTVLREEDAPSPVMGFNGPDPESAAVVTVEEALFPWTPSATEGMG